MQPPLGLETTTCGLLNGCSAKDAQEVMAAASTSPTSRLFGLSACWCEHRPVCAQLSRHKSNGTLGRRYTRVTSTQRRAALVLRKRWQRRVSALSQHLRQASRQGVARCCRGKVDVACCVVHNHDVSLNCSRTPFPTDPRFSP